MRKISASLAVLMLLVLCAPVLTYAASILKVYYNATTGDISGVIYSDNKNISLSMDQDGENHQVPSAMLGEVYHSNSANVYWAKVNGKIDAGLKPDNATVIAGDTRSFAASVADNVYSFENGVVAPYWVRQDTYLSSQPTGEMGLQWRSPFDFGFSHYNLYENGQLISSPKDPYYWIFNLPFHSMQNFEVSVVDILNHESARSSFGAIRVPGLVAEGEVLFNGKGQGSSLQPNEGLIAFRPSSQPLDNKSGFDIQLTLPEAPTYEFSSVPFLFDGAEIEASDFELVDDSGRIIHIDRFIYLGDTLQFEFDSLLNAESKYTLKLSSTASGKEIHVPNVNTRLAHVYFYLKSSGDTDNYSFEYSPRNIVFGTFPDKPTGLTVTAGDGTFNLNWDANKEADLAGYLVWLDGKLLTELPIQKTTFFIDGLLNGKKYHVNVAAVNKNGGRSYQAYLFPIPQALTQSGGGGGGSGGTGLGMTDTVVTTPAVTMVDQTGTEKTLDIVLKSDSGKVTVSVGSDIKQLLLPALSSAINKDNMLVVTKDNFSLQIPGQVLEQLKASVQADQLKNARISVAFNPLTSEDIAKEMDKAAGKSASTTITSAGAAFDISLSLLAADGKETKLAQFNLPVTLKLKVNGDSNLSLTGIYYLNDQGELQYIGGKLDNGYLTTEISHFSKYAVLQYSKTFSDVPATHWALGAIQSLVAQQVVTGTSDLTFSPDKNVTRAEFAAFIARKLNLEASSTSRFSDVVATKWYADEVAAVAEAGIVTGTSESIFAPELTISRQEMVAMLMKAYNYKNKQPLSVLEEDHPFADATSISEWAKAYASSAHQLGWIQGRSGNKFEPLQSATRAEAVQLISKL
ncbi:S-layer homology domain-containing protein [Paenibacillus monticola]|uniref:S-layer homology domain-containing protein n=1 Tax=Paenibacillus monticola TaxID=2666075 RepID=A0A7X2H164_9BACL|nr:S-layer homology domain-containing protein [Paenibacillus monticola]MRN51649.1 hypothetical protein [Paenibacillus monticola]